MLQRRCRHDFGTLVAIAAILVVATPRAICQWTGEADRQQQFLQSLMDREPPPATVPALDPSKLVLDNKLSPEEELAAIAVQLRAVVDAWGYGTEEQTWGAIGSIAPRLALFRWRYGSEPAGHKAGPEFVRSVSQVLAQMDAGTLSKTDFYQGLFHATLLQIVGRSAEGSEQLAALNTWTGCGNCTAGRIGEIEARRSEAAQARGDLSAAVDFQGLKVFQPLAGCEGDAVSVTRLGLLLLEQGRREGASLLQFVVDLQPQSRDVDLARAALAQVGALHEPTPERLRRVYVEGLSEYDVRAILARRILEPAHQGH